MCSHQNRTQASKIIKTATERKVIHYTLYSISTCSEYGKECVSFGRHESLPKSYSNTYAQHCHICSRGCKTLAKLKSHICTDGYSKINQVNSIYRFRYYAQVKHLLEVLKIKRLGLFREFE